MTSLTFSLGRGFTLTRTFAAPPSIVFAAWMSSQMLAGWTMTIDRLEF